MDRDLVRHWPIACGHVASIRSIASARGKNTPKFDTMKDFQIAFTNLANWSMGATL
jgi:hypothetical protein